MGEAFVYILKSTSSGKHYVGCTQDPDRRVMEHNSGKTISTRGRGLWQLIYLRQFESLSVARQHEAELKRKKSAKYIDWLIAEGKHRPLG